MLKTASRARFHVNYDFERYLSTKSGGSRLLVFGRPGNLVLSLTDYIAKSLREIPDNENFRHSDLSYFLLPDDSISTVPSIIEVPEQLVSSNTIIISSFWPSYYDNDLNRDDREIIVQVHKPKGDDYRFKLEFEFF